MCKNSIFSWNYQVLIKLHIFTNWTEAESFNPLSDNRALKRAQYINSEEQTLPWIPNTSVNHVSVYS